MTELYIDGVLAVLPQSFSIQVKRENPLITKNGEYTYDVTLDLTNRINADLYRHLNRLNTKQPLPTKRRAVLIADNRVYCNGTEVITGWSDKTVSVQIVSGNSELNFLIGGDREISSLTSMPETDPSDNPVKFINHKYPDVDYCLAPVIDGSLNLICNAWGVKRQDTNIQLESFSGGTKYVQPFLVPYIRHVIEALGYTIDYNVIETTVYRELYICQVYHSSKWCEMLPKWTVTDFLQQIEYFFNGIFLVDNRSRKIQFISRSDYFANTTPVYIANVSDAYEAEFVEKPDIDDMADANVAYKVDDGEFWKFHTLSEAVRKIAKYDTIPADFDTSDERSSRLRAWFNIPEHQKKDTIYKDLLDGYSYLYIGLISDNPSSPRPNKQHVYYIVDDFNNLERGDNAADIELEIGPATFTCNRPPVLPDINGDYLEYVDCMFPVIVSSGNSADSSLDNLADIIRGSKQVPSHSKSRISLAFFDGCNFNLALVGKRDEYVRYPLPFIDKKSYRVGWIDDAGNYTTLTPVDISDEQHSLRLSRLNEVFYNSRFDIDFNHEIKLTSYDNAIYNPRCLFIIGNKYYICKDIEYTLNANGRKGLWTGTFYPIRIAKDQLDLS